MTAALQGVHRSSESRGASIAVAGAWSPRDVQCVCARALMGPPA